MLLKKRFKCVKKKGNTIKGGNPLKFLVRRHVEFKMTEILKLRKIGSQIIINKAKTSNYCFLSKAS